MLRYDEKYFVFCNIKAFLDMILNTHFYIAHDIFLNWTEFDSKSSINHFYTSKLNWWFWPL